MSPLADRKDPNDWAESVDASPATGRPAKGGPPGGEPTPNEPVGGWVDGSTGRGKILVPARSARERAPSPEDEEADHEFSGPARASEERSSDAAPGTSSESRARRRKEKEQAAAEAAAEERQEEDRNHQGALDDMAEAEADQEADEGR